MRRPKQRRDRFECPTAEFFAGIGLMRQGLMSAGFKVVWANDVAPSKRDLYERNFGDRHFHLGDVAKVHADGIPDVGLATASFPCTDLSLAGGRAGLKGKESSLLWHFTRIIGELEDRKPKILMLENVPGLASSRGGEDLVDTISRLNGLGYWCDLLQIDARWFVPQSRQRLFIIGARSEMARPDGMWEPCDVRPNSLCRFANSHRSLDLRRADLPGLVDCGKTLEDIVDLPEDEAAWWPDDRRRLFEQSLAQLHTDRLKEMKESPTLSWRTAYRRTRNGKPTWEIRGDEIAGCLRTAKGGSSKQALVEAGRGRVRVRWMSPSEYARLQGAPHFKLDREGNAYSGFGDAVCVPVIEWLATSYLRPLLQGKLLPETAQGTFSYVPSE